MANKITITNEKKTMELFKFVAENFDWTTNYRYNIKTKLIKIYIITKDNDFKIPKEPVDSNIVAEWKG